MNRIYKNWPMHNLLAHPLMEILGWFGMKKLANWIHDVTLPVMIEIGKQYRIINSLNGHDGKIVTVIGYGGKNLEGLPPIQGDRWYVDRYLETTKGSLVNHIGEKQLKPIYDGDEKR